MTVGAKPAQLRGEGYVLRADGTKVPFVLVGEVPPEHDEATRRMVEEFNKNSAVAPPAIPTPEE